MKLNLSATENVRYPAFQLQACFTVLKMNRVAVSWTARVACARGNECSFEYVCVCVCVCVCVLSTGDVVNAAFVFWAILCQAGTHGSRS